MWRNAAHYALNPFVKSVLLSRLHNRSSMSMPVDLPTAHASGPDPDRILLLGGLVVRGLGVASYDLGIAGTLARQLSARTGRGADIEARGIPFLSAARAVAELRAERLERYDLLLLMLGGREAMSFRPRRLWRRDIRRLVAALGEFVPKTVPVLIVSIPPFALDFDVPVLVQRALMRTTRRLNAETQRACEDSGFIEFVPVAPRRVDDPNGPVSSVYAGWAAEMVPPVGNALTAAAPGQRAIPDIPADERLRQVALDDLHVVGSIPNAAVNQIVEMARNVFGVSAASVTLLDHDRQWIKSASGISEADTAREEAFCNTTIQHPGVYIIEDVDKAPQFRDASWVAGPDHVRFYAGYPLEAPGGQRVGALCVMDRNPREFGPGDVTMLRDLALRAQDAIWEAARKETSPERVRTAPTG